MSIHFLPFDSLGRVLCYLTVFSVVTGVFFTCVLSFFATGGVFGLWIGWSVLTFFEFTELASDFLAYCCLKKRLKPPTDSSKLEKLEKLEELEELEDEQFDRDTRRNDERSQPDLV